MTKYGKMAQKSFCCKEILTLGWGILNCAARFENKFSNLARHQNSPATHPGIKQGMSNSTGQQQKHIYTLYNYKTLTSINALRKAIGWHMLSH